MNVLQLNALDKGGAAIAAQRLHEGLSKEYEINSIFVSRKNLKPFSDNRNLFKRCFYSINWRITHRKYFNKDILNEIDGFHGIKGLLKGKFLNQLPETDIINLHWINEFIDYKSFFYKFAGKVPIVWTLHDMNPFLGGCHYSLGAALISSLIGKGLSLEDRRRNDIDRQIWEGKNIIFSKIKDTDMTIVTPSKWLHDESKKSPFFSRFKHSIIPNGINTDVFNIKNINFCKNKLNIPENKNIILFSAENILKKRKGFGILLQALNKLDYKKYYCLAIGNNNNIPNNENIHFTGYVNSEELLSDIYNSADLFIIPSREDNLPNTVLESLACGTPVVGSNVGGIPDMVRDGVTGFLFESENSEDLASKINIFFSLSENNRKAMIDRCRAVAVEEYALEIQAKSYIKLYKDILRTWNLKH